MPQQNQAIFSFGQILKDILNAHEEHEYEDFFCAGSSQTTPHLCCIDARWRFPWYSVLFTLGLIVFVLTFMLAELGARVALENVKLFLGTLMVGSVAVPLGLLSVFSEMNLWRNISWVRLLLISSVGGVLSLALALLLFVLNMQETIFNAGFIEEPSKVLIALLLAGHKGRNGRLLNGMLYGAAVGAGFAVFESMGYAYEALLIDGDADAMNYQGALIVMGIRSLFALTAGHVTWTAITSAALWYSMSKWRGLKAIFHPFFLLCLAAAAVIHGFWNESGTAGNLPYLAPLLGLVTWVLIVIFQHVGIAQIIDTQKDWLRQHGDEDKMFILMSNSHSCAGSYSANELITRAKQDPSIRDAYCIITEGHRQCIHLSSLCFIRTRFAEQQRVSWYQNTSYSWLKIFQILFLGSILSMVLVIFFPAVGIAGYFFCATLLTGSIYYLTKQVWTNMCLPSHARDSYGHLKIRRVGFTFLLRFFIPLYQYYWGYIVATDVVRCMNYNRKGMMRIPMWIPLFYCVSLFVSLTLSLAIIVGGAYSFVPYTLLFILLYPISAYLMGLALMSEHRDILSLTDSANQ